MFVPFGGVSLERAPFVRTRTEQGAFVPTRSFAPKVSAVETATAPNTLSSPPSSPVTEPEPGDPLAVERAALQEEQQRVKAALAAEIAEVRATEKASSAALIRAADALEDLHTGLLENFRSQAADVVVAAAIHIAGEGLKVQPELLDALLSEAIQALGMNELVLHVSVADEPRIRSAFESRPERRRTDRRVDASGEPSPDRRVSTAPYDGPERRGGAERRTQPDRRSTTPQRVTVIADPAITGGCVVQGPTGRIDASLGTAAAALIACSAQWKGG
jgi:hypothetical protein